MSGIGISGQAVTVIALAVFTALALYKGLKVVPQSERWTVERFGRYTRTLNAGLNVIVPWVDRVAQRVSVLERQLEQARISVITQDNVEVIAEATVFFRIDEPEKAVYRIRDAEGSIATMATSVVRSAAGKLELDEIQSSRGKMNAEIATAMEAAASEWGIQITRTEITDVVVDDSTKQAQRQQLVAARERRAVEERAQGEREAVQLKADGDLYAAKRQAEGIRVTADAKAYEVERTAKAEAERTRVVGAAIGESGGSAAIDYEVRKLQVDAIGKLGSGPNSATVVLPTDVVGVLGAMEVAARTLGQARNKEEAVQ